MHTTSCKSSFLHKKSTKPAERDFPLLYRINMHKTVELLYKREREREREKLYTQCSQPHNICQAYTLGAQRN